MSLTLADKEFTEIRRDGRSRLAALQSWLRKWLPDSLECRMDWDKYALLLWDLHLKQLMTFKHRQYRDTVVFDAIDNTITVYKNLANIGLTQLWHHSAYQRRIGGISGALSEFVHPLLGVLRTILRNIGINSGKIVRGSVGPTQFHSLASLPSRTSSSIWSSITLPACTSSRPCCTADMNRVWALSRSNSLGDSTTAAGLPFWVMMMERLLLLILFKRAEACVLNWPSGNISSEICKVDMFYTLIRSELRSEYRYFIDQRQAFLSKPFLLQF